MKLDKSTKIGIVGLGLIGGSYAMGLTEKGYEVGAVARRDETIKYALERKMISHGMSKPDPDYISQFDILVFSLYPHAFLEWLDNYQQFIKPGALITDVTGVKGCVVYDVQAKLRDDLEFIAAHPMAGRESKGIEYADNTVFHGANYIVTPTDKNTKEAIELCKEIGRELGFTRISELTPEKHDEMIGFLSQLTHCIALSLMTCRDTQNLAEYTGDSFRDLTRIANMNDEMWSELFLLNKTELLNQMDMFEDAFRKLRRYIIDGKREEMREMMRFSTEQRKLFDKPKITE